MNDQKDGTDQQLEKFLDTVPQLPNTWTVAVSAEWLTVL